MVRIHPSRRRILSLIGSGGLIGIAGCFSTRSDPSTPTEAGAESDPNASPDTGSSPETTSNQRFGNTTPTTARTNPPADTATATDTAICALPDGPTPLFVFDDGSPSSHQYLADERLHVTPNTEMITGTITNPYLYELRNGEVRLTPPTADWVIDPKSGTSFESMAPQTSQDASWTVTVPDEPGTEYTLRINEYYEACHQNTYGPQIAEIPRDQPVVIDSPE